MSLVFFSVIAACTINRLNELQTRSDSFSPSQTERISDNNFPETPTISNSPTIQLVNPSWKIDPKYDTLFNNFSITQGPFFASTTVPNDSQYLYKNMIVTFELVDNFDAVVYLNLDDLNNNGSSNSDIRIERTIGNPEINYFLDPSNNAHYFYVGNNRTNIDLCKKSISNLKLSEVDYSLQREFFIKGGNYCILTNEGRIGIVNYIIGSKKAVGKEYEEVLSVNITVYNEIIN
jgi:hypothetical protein